MAIDVGAYDALPPDSDRVDLDLGDGHLLAFNCWNPDRALNPQYEGLPDVEKWGATIYHRTDKTETGWCAGAVTFDGPVQKQLVPDRGRWQVQSWEPLTISPSLLCGGCGDHGFIRAGKWVRA